LYQGFYHLNDHPFRLTPDPAYVCLTAQHREALSGLLYSVRTRLGLTVLIGEAGTGKTTILRTLTDLFQGRNFVLARCSNPTLSREEFYDLLLAELGVECASPLKSRQLRALEAALTRFRDAGQSAILIVDEAQRLPLELLEEIRLLLNLETPREKLLQIVMAGQPELGEIIGRPELRQLKQRISAIFRLKPLSIEELREYLEHRLSRAGLPKQNLFTEELIGLIYRYTQGIPRLVNSLCDAALRRDSLCNLQVLRLPLSGRPPAIWNCRIRMTNGRKQSLRAKAIRRLFQCLLSARKPNQLRRLHRMA